MVAMAVFSRYSGKASNLFGRPISLFDAPWVL